MPGPRPLFAAAASPLSWEASAPLWAEGVRTRATCIIDARKAGAQGARLSRKPRRSKTGVRSLGAPPRAEGASGHQNLWKRRGRRHREAFFTGPPWAGERAKRPSARGHRPPGSRSPGLPTQKALPAGNADSTAQRPAGRDRPWSPPPLEARGPPLAAGRPPQTGAAAADTQGPGHHRRPRRD